MQPVRGTLGCMGSGLGVVVQVSVLGSVGVRRNGSEVELGPRLRRLLAALTVANGSVMSSDRLVDIVWAGDPPEGADKTLRSYVTRLRQALDPDRDDLIVFRQPGYLIDLRPGELDSEVFDDELERALQHLRTADATTAAELLSTAIRRWRGPAYAGFAEEQWARPESVRLEERRLEAREALVEARLLDGAVEQAVADAQSLVEIEPLRERSRALLMRALYASGRQAEALRVFANYRRFLVDEAGLDPSEEIVELESRIARGDPGLGGPSRALRGYELGERIGEGAFAVVHRGVQPGIDRDVAVKIIRPELADRADFIRRFDVEARTIARIEHPNVVPLYDYWREPGAAYLVMRLLRGGTVEAALRARGPFGRDQTLRLLDEVGGALSAAHRVGVVHRDVRPGNLLLDGQGTTYLSDFGIALPVSVSDDLPIVSPAYAAPEVLRGEPAGVAADVLSLGVTVFEVLTGRLPFADSVDRADLIRRQMSEPLPPVRATRTDLPVRVDEVLARATSKVASDRHPSVAALVDDLRSALAADRTGVSTTGRLVAGPVENPYVGLHAFDEMDADRFFGRFAVVTEVVEAMVDHPVVTVVGPSGAGKSSIVRAGVLPAIRRGGVPGSDQWFVTTMLPGRDPIDSLETALLRVAVNPPASLREQLAEPGGLLRAVRRVLPDDHTTVLLVIDQFEEVFTQVADREQRERFLSELAAAVTAPGSPLRIVATLRADHYDAPLRHRGMAELVTAGTVTVRPMSPEELQRAISGPAEQVGVDVEPALVAELVAEVDDHPGALPLLQFSLTELFDRRVADVMQLSSLRDLGGITGALAARADRIVESGDPADEAEVRRIFGRLVTLGEGTEDTRRRALRSELGDSERTAWLIEKFVSARLLATDRDEASREPTVEVAHEALLRDWPRLRRWLDDDRADLTVLRTITANTASWEVSGRDDGELARGGRLELVTDLADRRPHWLTEPERDWVGASRAAAEAEAEAAAAAAERDRRQNRRLRGLLVAASLLLVLALIATTVALVLRSRAVEAQEDADIERLIALSASQIAEAPDRAILLALEANRRRDDIATQTAIHRAITTEARLAGIFPDILGEPASLVASDDGTVLVAGGFDSGVVEWVDPATGDRLAEPYVAPTGIDTIGVSGDGSTIGVALIDHRVLFVDRTGTAVGSEQTFPGTVWRIALDRDGSTAAVIAGRSTTVDVVDVETGDLVTRYEPTTDATEAVLTDWVGLTPDGDRLVVSIDEARLALAPFEAVDIVDTATGQLVSRVVSEHGWVSALDVSSDRVVIGYDDGTVETTDLDGNVSTALDAHSSQVVDLLAATDGRILTADRNAVRIWSSEGRPAGEPLTVSAEIITMALREDGRFVLGGRSVGHLLVDPGRSAIVRDRRPVPCYSQVHPELPYHEMPSPDFGSLVYVDLASGETVRELDISALLPNGLAGAPFYSADGRWVVVYDDVADVMALVEVRGDRIHSIAGAELVEIVTGEPDPDAVKTVRPGRGGSTIFTTVETQAGDGRAAWLDVESLEILAGPVDLEVVAPSLVLADGRVVMGGEDETMIVLPADLETPPLTIDGSQGMMPYHEDPITGLVLAGGPGDKLGLVDPDLGSISFFEDATGLMHAGAFSPDGSRVAAVSPEAGVQLFDTASRSAIGVPMDLAATDECDVGPGLRWSEDGAGAWVVAGGGPTQFAADPEVWRRTACEIVNRELTAEEWATFVSPDTEPVPACPDQPDQ